MEKEILTVTINNIQFQYQNNTLFCYESNIKFNLNLLNLLLLPLYNEKTICFLNMKLDIHKEDLLKQWVNKNGICLEIINKKNNLVEKLILSKQ